MSIKSIKQKYRRHESVISGSLLTLPGLILLVIFQIAPIFYTLRLSVAKGPGFSIEGFVGLDNFSRLFSDSRFLNLKRLPLKGALINSIQWVIVAVPIVIIIGLLVALVADRSKYQTIIRSAFFLPMVISGTAVGIIWQFVYSPNPNVGMLNAAINSNQSWLGDPKTVNSSLMAAWIWGQTGMSVVIIAAALKGIPEEMIEAARVDGASGWKMLFQITLPSIRGQLSFLIITQLVQVLKVFDVVYVMTNGGPAGLSRTLALFFYEQTFVSLNPQYGAAIVTVMSIVIVLIYSIVKRNEQQTP